MMRSSSRIAPILTLFAAATASAASETVTFSYDALGRLINSATSGTVNDGLSVSTNYDPAGNRTAHGVGVPPPPVNQAPNAVNDSGSMTKCEPKSFAVLGNDADPDGNLPLALVSASGGGARGTASLQGTSILFTPSGLTGSAVVTYAMRDSLGATDSATLTITITNGTCGNN